MIPVVSFVGDSNTGKTSLVEKVVAELSSRGCKVGTAKFTRCDFDPDTEGKDTFRHTAAGAFATALVAPRKTALFVPSDPAPTLDEIVYQYFTLADIVIVEGGKEQECDKIWVKGDGPEPRGFNAEDMIAVASPSEFEAGVPVFDRNDAKGISDFIQNRYLKNVSRSEVRVWIDGKFLPVKPFVKAFIGQTIKGMLSSLKGGKKGERIHIKIGR
ncbi:MAG: Molybdopterin-guanine dinucleotide biosynthesis adapter protein [bacterium ADurb.Bin236]|nr:MAG: Molybdopterin-guanine dinucleotide biosynthesis adapter protein [bacterium ADurb.Bin236]HPN93880.1 molybdopterin-guanine dinucleotide biosynthesis protein B [bacterium]